MKKFVLIFAFCFFSLTVHAQDFKVNQETKNAVYILEKLNILPSEFELSLNATRLEYLTMLMKIDDIDSSEFPDLGIVNDIMLKYDDTRNLNSNELRVLAEADMKGILKGKMSNGKFFAAPDSDIIWREALIFSLRVIMNVERYYESDDQQIVNIARNYNLIDYNFDEDDVLWLDEAVTNNELCVLAYRLLHAPARINSAGGEYTKYYIDDFIK